MSGNQTKFDKSGDYRKKAGRSGTSSGGAPTYQRTYSNSSSRNNTSAGASGGSVPTPPLNSNRTASFNKSSAYINSNAQGGQSAVNSQVSVAAAGPSHAQHRGGGGLPEQKPIRGPSGAAASEVASRASESSSSQRSNRAAPKTPSQSAAMNSDIKSQTTPVKEEAPKAIAVQFGSISPGFMNGMQIPARTSSAPPNLDEQKRNQVRIDSFRVVPPVPVPALPKQQLPEKEAGVSKQVQGVEPHSVSRVKKEPHVSSISSSPLTQKPPNIPMGGIPLQVSYHQQQVSLPFGGPNPPIQSQGIPGASMHVPLPMHYPMGSAPQMFVQGIQPHTVQHQVMMHPGQGMSFPAQMGPHMSHQIGNLGMQMPPPYAPQQAGKFVPARKAVIITHPDTHEELKLEKRGDKYGEGGGPRAHSSAPAKSQTPSYSSGPSTNLYPNSYSSSPYFVSPSNLPITTAQGNPSSHAQRFNPVTQGPQASGFMPPSTSTRVVVSAPNNHSSKSSTTVAVKDQSLKTGAEGNADGKSSPVDSQKLSANSMLDPEPSDNASVPPAIPGSASTESAPVNNSDEGTNEDTIGKFLKKPDNKENTEDQFQDSLLSPSTTLTSEAIGNSKANIIKVEISEEESNSSTEPSSNGDTASGFAKASSPENIESQQKYAENVSLDEPLEEPISEVALSHASPRSDFEATESSSSAAKDSLLDTTSTTSPDASVLKSDVKDADPTLRVEGDDDALSFPVTDDKSASDLSRPKSAALKGKKKKKEILQKADAAGTTSDLYLAYKVPEEQKEIILPPESLETDTVTSDLVPVDSAAKDDQTRVKGEPDDWEDAADIGTPKVGVGEQQGESALQISESLTKKYSRDFLLKLQTQSYYVPEDFDPRILPDALVVSNASKGHLERDSYPSPGRPTGGPRPDCRGPAMDDDKWNKAQGHFVHNRDQGNNFVQNRGPGGNFGVLRNPRQTPGHFPGSNQSGPPQSLNTTNRNNTEADRWQRGSNFQKGLMPSPPTPAQIIHKAERKYEVGKVADEEQSKQRQLKAILNKLTPQNFEKLFEQVKAVNIDSAITLTGVISQIFDKALMEPTFCEMYADFCRHLSEELPDFSEDNEKITFKRVLLNKCQEEFERGEREQEAADRDEESEIVLSKEAREEKRVQARRRMLGNIRLIGELFKKKMLTERIMHSCITKLLGQHQNPDEEDLEALCKLMSTIGEMIDHHVAKPHMDTYFDMMGKLSVNMNLSSRVRFMLKDAIDLRKNKWQQRRKVEGPKKIEEVHRDAAHERQAQASRLTRGPGINSSGRRGPSTDFGPRGSSSMSSPSSHSGNFRGNPSQSRAFGNQDMRSDDRQTSFESRTLSVPLRAVRDDTITLGPQGGLARGMSSRGPASSASTTQVDRPLSSGEIRRREAVYGSTSSVTERPTSGSSDDAVGRSAPERFTSSNANNRRGVQDHIIVSDRETKNVGSSFDKTSTSSNDKPFSDERLEEMSFAAIKEFYSAKDKNEVSLCIRDLKSPSFYPSMIALWVMDSFERKDMHRDLLTELLINLSKPPSSILSQQDLLKGFEFVLSTLEDAVNDAPRAPEFLGHILAKALMDDVVPLADLGVLLREGGEGPGTLLDAGLAGDVLGIILEAIQAEKGDSVLNEILLNANLKLEDFRPPEPKKSKNLEKFIK